MTEDIKYIDDSGAFLYQPCLLILENDCKKPCNKISREESLDILYQRYILHRRQIRNLPDVGI